MTTINIKSSSRPTTYHLRPTSAESWPFLYSFFGMFLLTLVLSLQMFDLPGPYKIAIFYLGFLAAMPSLLHASSRRRLTLGWQKTQKGALRLIALL